MTNKDLLIRAQNNRFGSADEFIKELLLNADHPNQLLRDMVAKGPSVWKLLLSANPRRRILEVGAGPDSIIHHLLGPAGSFLLADSSHDRLAFSKCFHRLRKEESAISYLQFETLDNLPLLENSFDCAVLNLRHLAPVDTAPLLMELRRVLGSSGQLVLIVENWLNWELLSLPHLINSHSFSFIGYRKLLVRSGFPESNFHALVYHDSDLKKVIHFTGTARGMHRMPAAKAETLKSRLKHGLLSSEYAIISGAHGDPSLLDSIMVDVSRKLRGVIGPGSLTLLDHEITRKDKVVFFARWGQTRLILKLPLTYTATATEGNNAAILDLLQQDGDIREYVPHALARDCVEGSPYFVESMLPGTSLSELVTTHGRKQHIEDVFSLLKRLACSSSGLRTTILTGEIYEKFIQTPIATIARITGDSNLGATLESYFRSRLHGIDLKMGLMHGDFSVSNLLYNEGRSLSVIDWETAEPQGVPVLDAINFLDSLQRLSVRGTRINQTIPQLAARNWSESDEIEFLDRCYELYGIDPGLHEPLVYLRWLRHMGFLIQFWLRFDRRAQDTFIYDVAVNLK